MSIPSEVPYDRDGFTTNTNNVVPIYKILGTAVKAASQANDYKSLIEIVKIMQENNLKELVL